MMLGVYGINYYIEKSMSALSDKEKNFLEFVMEDLNSLVEPTMNYVKNWNWNEMENISWEINYFPLLPDEIIRVFNDEYPTREDEQYFTEYKLNFFKFCENRYGISSEVANKMFIEIVSNRIELSELAKMVFYA
jgi:hypothetical protein